MLEYAYMIFHVCGGALIKLENAYIVDVILIAVFAISVLVSWKRGFILTLLDFAALIVSGVASVLISGAFAPQIYNEFISSRVLETISASLNEVSFSDLSAQVSLAIASLPEFVSSYALKIGIDIPSLSAQIASSSQGNAENLAVSIEQSIAAPILTAACKAILFLVLFFVLLILLKILVRLVSKTAKHVIPALEGVDKALGIVFGILKGAVLVFALCTVVAFAADLLTESLPEFKSAVEQSKIVGLINGFNPVTDYLS